MKNNTNAVSRSAPGNINQAVKKHEYTSCAVESWHSRERVGQVPTLPKPCLLHTLSIITTLPMVFLHYPFIAFCRDTNMTRLQVFGLISQGFFWSEYRHPVPTFLYFWGIGQLKNVPQKPQYH